MLKKVKKVILSVLLAVTMLSTCLIASAAEPSEKVIEDGNHSVYAFGKSVVFIVGDTIEIVPNNDTKMIDVMIDGKVSKGLQRLEMKNAEGNKVASEEGSMILECDSKAQVQELIDRIATGMENGTPMQSIDELVGEQENVAAFMIDDSGSLVDENGKAVTGNNAPKVEVDSVSNVSVDFQAEQQELREEMKQQEERERLEILGRAPEIRYETLLEKLMAELESSSHPEIPDDPDEGLPPASTEPSVEPSVEPTPEPTELSTGSS